VHHPAGHALKRAILALLFLMDLYVAPAKPILMIMVWENVWLAQKIKSILQETLTLHACPAINHAIHAHPVTPQTA